MDADTAAGKIAERMRGHRAKMEQRKASERYIHTRGYFTSDVPAEIGLTDADACDEPLVAALGRFFKREGAGSVVDLGCGGGLYTRRLNELGVNTSGFDGNPHTKEITRGLCDVLDLSEPHTFPTQYDWVLSLEVGEHLPVEYEDVFIGNLHRNNVAGIVLSWAVVGQGGDGHVNERNNDYIRDKVCALGYEAVPEAEKELRGAARVWWFRNTVMVFRRRAPAQPAG